jgi:hypothetical protein
MRNESTTDRGIRLLIAVGAAALAFVVGAGTVGGLALLAVGTIMLVTAAVGFCPLYRLFGISTYKVPAGR